MSDNVISILCYKDIIINSTQQYDGFDILMIPSLWRHRDIFPKCAQLISDKSPHPHPQSSSRAHALQYYLRRRRLFESPVQRFPAACEMYFPCHWALPILWLRPVLCCICQHSLCLKQPVSLKDLLLSPACCVRDDLLSKILH